MATVEAFETTLKEVVKGKRLSASKMNKLTEISMKLMDHDTQLVSILYRTHKSLPSSCKISSFYCFDALCRAARHHAIKQNLSSDVEHAEKGNCATFLSKIEGVLDGLFQDLLTSGIPEAKEKTKKILDIWTKSSTFPANVLTRLLALGGADENPKETKHAASSSAPTTTDPRKHPTPPSEVTPPPVVTTPTAESAQAALLALLTSAATAKGTTVSQTVTNTLNQASATPPQQPQLEQIQLALLHQLSKNTSVGAGTGSNVPPSQAPIVSLIPPPFIPNHPPPTIPQQNFNYPGPSSRSPPNTESYKVPERRDPRASKFDDAPVGAAGSGRGRGAYYDDRRGGPQSGPLPSREEFRGRGHNNIRGGGRYGGRERDYESSAWESQERKSDWGPPSRRRSSRSRSPPSRAVGNPNGRQYSPPRRHSHASPVDLSRPKPPGASDAGKDEFGRDIRPTSEEPGEVTTLESVRVETRESSRATDETPDISRQQQLPPPTGGDTLSTTNKFNLAQSKGLESFDITTFDPTNAASWKALGDAFQVSNGYMPSQEELMQLVMSSMGMMMAMGAAGAMGGVPVGSDNEDALPAGKEHTIGVQDWGTDTYGGKSYGQGSDAVILGQDGGSPKSNNASQYQDSEDGGSGGLGGKMQKVGDRWMFVRDGA